MSELALAAFAAETGSHVVRVPRDRAFRVFARGFDEGAYLGRFGNILDSAAGVGKDYSEATVKSQLDAAAKEADGLLAQSAG